MSTEQSEHDRRLFGLAAEFDSPEAILEAARRLRERGYRHAEAYTPFPITGLSESLGYRKTWVPFFVLIGGFGGAGAGFLMQWFANVVHLPWNIGGRPMNSWPAFIPITFEMGILGAALSAVIGMLVMNKLPQLYHPMFRLDEFVRASQDRFFICIESSDPQFDLSQTRSFLEGLNPLAVMEVPA